MSDLDPDIVEEALTLVVGWRRGVRVEGGRVDVTEEVGEVLRGICADVVASLDELEAKPYAADTHLEAEEYLVVGEDDLDGSSEVLELVRYAAEVDDLSAGDLPNRPLLFYAIVFGDTPEERVGFIRNTNPMYVAKRGGLLTTLRGALTTVDEPIFGFDNRVDVVVLPEGLLVFKQPAFERLFRDLPALVAKVPEWLAAVAAHLPIAPEAIEELDARARSDSRLRRRLLAIHERGHLQHVTIAQIRREAKTQGIDPSQVIRDGQLVLDELDAASLLRLLNEDLMTGGLSGARFSVDRKTLR